MIHRHESDEFEQKHFTPDDADVDDADEAVTYINGYGQRKEFPPDVDWKMSWEEEQAMLAKRADALQQSEEQT